MKRDGLYRGEWGKDDIKNLKRWFPHNPTKQVAADLGRPTEAVKKRASRLGLRKSRKRMRELGKA